MIFLVVFVEIICTFAAKFINLLSGVVVQRRIKLNYSRLDFCLPAARPIAPSDYGIFDCLSLNDCFGAAPFLDKNCSFRTVCLFP